jgi:hypothetical protein
MDRDPSIYRQAFYFLNHAGNQSIDPATTGNEYPPYPIFVKK